MGLHLVNLSIAYCQRFQFRCLHSTFRNTVFSNYMYLKFLLTINPHPLYIKKNIPDTFNYAISGGNYVLDLTVLVLLKWPLEYTCTNEQVYHDKRIKTCVNIISIIQDLYRFTLDLYRALPLIWRSMHQTLFLRIDIHERYKLQSCALCIFGYIYVMGYTV